MSRVTGKPPTATHWRRPITRTYDYNMTLGENYYKPQLDYIATRKGRGKTPPSATTFAERLLQYPPGRRSASASRRAEDEFSSLASTGLTSASAVAAKEEMSTSSMGRYASLDDLGLDEDMSMRRRRLLLQNSQENLAADRGRSPLMSPGSGGGGRLRVTFGDKMLDAVGVKDESMQQSAKKQSLFSSEDGDAIDHILAERRSRRQAGLKAIQSADADLLTEDPFTSPQLSNRLQQARQQLDQMREEMKTEADSSTSRFRNRLRAKREKEQRDDHEHYGSLSALNESSLSSNAGSAKAISSTLKLTSQSQQSSTLASSSSAMSAAAHQSLMAQAEEDDAETAAILSKVEQIRKRAKARLAQINDDFGDLQIESSLASRRAATKGTNRQALLDDDLDSEFMPASRLANSSGGKSLAISKRTVRASYDIE